MVVVVVVVVVVKVVVVVVVVVMGERPWWFSAGIAAVWQVWSSALEDTVAESRAADSHYGKESRLADQYVFMYL